MPTRTLGNDDAAKMPLYFLATFAKKQTTCEACTRVEDYWNEKQEKKLVFILLTLKLTRSEL